MGIDIDDGERRTKHRDLRPELCKRCVQGATDYDHHGFANGYLINVSCGWDGERGSRESRGKLPRVYMQETTRSNLLEVHAVSDGGLFAPTISHFRILNVYKFPRSRVCEDPPLASQETFGPAG